MKVNLKPGTLVTILENRGVWFKKGDTGKVVKFENRKNGKEHWIIEVRNGHFSINEDNFVEGANQD
jgi:hypothetical protein